jgi:hypothetical protein
VLLATPPAGPRRLQLIDRTLGVLRAGGFDDVVVADLANVFNTFVTGFALDEAVARPGGQLSAADVAEFERRFRALPAERYPSIAALADVLLDPDMDRRFAFGLAALLDGVEGRFGRGERR